MVNVHKTLKEYNKNQLRVTIAKKQNRMTEELEEIQKDMQTIDMAIDFIKLEYRLAIVAHFIEGDSYEVLARKYGYSKNGMVYRVKMGIKTIESLNL